MDRPIEKKRGIRRKHIPYIAGAVFILAVCAYAIWGNHRPALTVEATHLDIDTVRRAQFDDFVRLSGSVQPLTTIRLSAIEGGVVAEKLVDEGTMVRAGQPIVRLTNANLNLSILESEAQLAEKQNFLRNTQVTMAQERLNLQKERAQYRLDVQRKQRKAEQMGKLWAEKLCSREDYLQAQEDADAARENLHLIIERQRQDSLYRSIQVKQMQESLDNMHTNLALVRSRVDELVVKAPVDGQLGLLQVEIGQSIAPGIEIGRVDVLSDYKIEAQIDEHYIDRVAPGLSATFDRQGHSFSLLLRKVYPEVRNKQFRTDFVFSGQRPDNIRTGQTYYLNLRLGEPQEAILIPRGAFYQTTGGTWIFVLSRDGKRAEKRSISIGRQNPDYYEVTSGLHAGERVITSGYESFGKAEELILK